MERKMMAIEFFFKQFLNLKFKGKYDTTLYVYSIIHLITSFITRAKTRGQES